MSKDRRRRGRGGWAVVGAGDAPGSRSTGRTPKLLLRYCSVPSSMVAKPRPSAALYLKGEGAAVEQARRRRWRQPPAAPLRPARLAGALGAQGVAQEERHARQRLLQDPPREPVRHGKRLGVLHGCEG